MVRIAHCAGRLRLGNSPEARKCGFVVASVLSPTGQTAQEAVMAITERQTSKQEQSEKRHSQPAGKHARALLLAQLPVTERRLQLAGVSTAVLEGGDGPPVILLHGPGGYAAHWMQVIPGLVTTHRVIAPDLPGHGDFDAVDRALDAERVLAWLDELIERTCKSAPTLVGELLGGAIAARYASIHSDLLGGLVLADTFGLVPFQPAPAFAQALTQFQAEPTGRTHQGLWLHCAHDLDGLRQRMGDRWEPFEAYNLDRARALGVHKAVSVLMEQFGMTAIPHVDLKRIASPTTLIWGRHDLATPLSVAEAASARYGWPLHVIENANDAPAMEQPGAFLAALRAALEISTGRSAATTSAISIAGVAGGRVSLTRKQIDDLASRLEGPLLRPGDEGWDDAVLIWNGMVTKAPALVIQPTSAHEVAAAVGFARDHGLLLSVKGGGHNIGGTAIAERGLMLDMSRMRSVTVIPEAKLAHAGPAVCSRTSTKRHRNTGWQPCSASYPRLASPA